MQNRDIDSPASANSNKLEDEDIIKFAEEVLGDPDDDIVELDDDETLKLDNDDIIDLTEIADKQIQSDDDILDLTEDVEITQESKDEFLELDDVTQESKNDDETLSGLADGEDDLTLLDDAVLDLDDVVEEITAVEQDIIAQDDTIAEERLTPSAGFMRATDNIELTEADQNALESEFGYETPVENRTDLDALNTLTSGDTEEEILLDFNDDVTEDAIEEVDLEADLLDDQPVEAPAVGGPHEKLALTETDRRILEEELGHDIDGNAASLLADEDAAVDTRSSLETRNDESDQPGDPAEPIRNENTVPLAAEEEYSGAADIAEIETDVDDAADMAIGQDPTEPSPDRPESTDESLAMEEDPDQVAVVDDIEADDSEPDTDVVMNDDDPVDEFDFDIDDTTERLDVDTDDLDFAPLTAEEELSVEALLAEVESPDDTEQPDKIDSKDARAAMNADTDESPPSAAQSDEKQAAAELDMDFDPVEATDEHDLHKVGDPILIRVKEPAAPDHADEDTLLKDVFDQKPDAEALPSAALETAVEKAVNKIFAEKIESILFDAIDRAVTKEIGRLKTLILGDRDQND
jgi:hypothetical protein